MVNLENQGYLLVRAYPWPIRHLPQARLQGHSVCLQTGRQRSEEAFEVDSRFHERPSICSMKLICRWNQTILEFHNLSLPQTDKYLLKNRLYFDFNYAIVGII